MGRVFAGSLFERTMRFAHNPCPKSGTWGTRWRFPGESGFCALRDPPLRDDAVKEWGTRALERDDFVDQRLERWFFWRDLDSVSKHRFGSLELRLAVAKEGDEGRAFFEGIA